MKIFGRGGLPQSTGFDGTFRSLINNYQTDPDSSYRTKRYSVRRNHDTLLKRLYAKHGHEEIRDIKARDLLAWHREWSADGKLPTAQAMIGQFRVLFRFGATILEDPECERLCAVMSKMRFPGPKPRLESMTAEQAVAVRSRAHEVGWHSIALAQAFQFELMFRQKDVIGEWVPVSEPGVSDILRYGKKWLVGIRWQQIDSSFVLLHTTSKRQKEIEVNLRLAPMVMEELAMMAGVAVADLTRELLPAAGPMILWDKFPYPSALFRKRWRKIATAAGVPSHVYNMDSRAGGITEASDAGADMEHIRHAATHSDIAMTQRYSRGSTDKIAGVMQLRIDHRNKPKPE